MAPDDVEHPPRPKYGLKIVLLTLLILCIPVVLVLGVFPLLNEQAFESVDELAPENIQSLQVQIHNRVEIDGGEPIRLYYADEADFAMLLEPLKAVPEVDNYPDAQGPWLGEYRIVTKSGRKGTIRFYWTKRPQDPPTAIRLRFKIGTHKFEGGSVQSIIDIARVCQPRGRNRR